MKCNSSSLSSPVPITTLHSSASRVSAQAPGEISCFSLVAALLPCCPWDALCGAEAPLGGKRRGNKEDNPRLVCYQSVKYLLCLWPWNWLLRFSEGVGGEGQLHNTILVMSTVPQGSQVSRVILCWPQGYMMTFVGSWCFCLRGPSYREKYLKLSYDCVGR